MIEVFGREVPRTLCAVPTGRNQSAYDYDVKALKPLHQLASEKRVAIIVVTHTRNTPADLENSFGRRAGQQKMVRSVSCDYVRDLIRGISD